jgi:hypothetical protein
MDVRGVSETATVNDFIFGTIDPKWNNIHSAYSDTARSSAASTVNTRETTV